MKPILAPVHQYGAQVEGLIGWEPEEANRYVLRWYNVDADFKADIGRTLILTHDKRPWLAVVFVPDFKNDATSIGLLVHECTHVAVHMLAEIKQEIEENSHEHFTYLVQYFVVEMLAGWRDQQKAKRAKKSKKKKKKR